MPSRRKAVTGWGDSEGKPAAAAVAEGHVLGELTQLPSNFTHVELIEEQMEVVF